MAHLKHIDRLVSGSYFGAADILTFPPIFVVLKEFCVPQCLAFFFWCVVLSSKEDPQSQDEEAGCQVKELLLAIMKMACEQKS